MGFSQNAEETEHAKRTTVQFQADAERPLEAKASWRSRINGWRDQINVKKMLLVLTLGYVAFTSYSCYSLPAPFLPREAEDKGLNPFEYGCIFASYELVRLFMAPLCASISIKMTPKVFLITGILIKSVCTPLFGLVAYTKSRNTFFICSLIVRMVWAIGGSATTTGCYLVGTLLFPKHIAIIFATLEMSIGIGTMAGPGLGGALYEAGGYSFPFYVMGLMCAVSIVPVYYLIEGDVKPCPVEEKVERTKLWHTFRIPGVYVNLIASAVVSAILGFNQGTLDFHVREVGNYSASDSGLVFLVCSLFYSPCTQLVGLLAKKIEKSYKYIIFGTVLCLIACAIIGPMPGIPIKPSMWLIVTSQAFMGLGCGFIFVLSFDDAVKEAIKFLPNSDSTMACISGLVTSSFALGNAIGPVAGGWLLNRLGYQKSTWMGIMVMCAFLILLLHYIIKNKKF